MLSNARSQGRQARGEAGEMRRRQPERRRPAAKPPERRQNGVLRSSPLLSTWLPRRDGRSSRTAMIAPAASPAGSRGKALRLPGGDSPSLERAGNSADGHSRRPAGKAKAATRLATGTVVHRPVERVRGHAAEGPTTDRQCGTHGHSPNTHIIVLFDGLNDDGASLTSRRERGMGRRPLVCAEKTRALTGLPCGARVRAWWS
jgi:hypothetical protein